MSCKWCGSVYPYGRRYLKQGIRHWIGYSRNFGVEMGVVHLLGRAVPISVCRHQLVVTVSGGGRVSPLRKNDIDGMERSDTVSLRCLCS
jgi:hypothetical protein